MENDDRYIDDVVYENDYYDNYDDGVTEYDEWQDFDPDC
jgi:hypothetical protein